VARYSRRKEVIVMMNIVGQVKAILPYTLKVELSAIEPCGDDGDLWMRTLRIVSETCTLEIQIMGEHLSNLGPDL
jgi:hypothetical protein